MTQIKKYLLAKQRHPHHRQQNSSRQSFQQQNEYSIQVDNLPLSIELQEIQNLFSQYGLIAQADVIDVNDGTKKRAILQFDSYDQAERAAKELDGMMIQDMRIKVTQLEDTAVSYLTDKFSGIRMSPRNLTRTPSHCEFPLRILVPTEMVGAIIGREGNTIRSITQQTQARVDVHRRESLGSAEKAITILGTPDSCTSAALQIAKIMQSELLSTNPQLKLKVEQGHPIPNIPLKILAHNNLIGRLIGKNGNVIKSIMNQTNSKITISKLEDLKSGYSERTITVIGTVENSSRAEALLSAKLRSYYKQDMASMIPQRQGQSSANSNSNGSSYPLSNSTTSSVSDSGSLIDSAAISPLSIPNSPSGLFSNNSVFLENDNVQSDEIETTAIYIPIQTFNYVIGARGNQLPALEQISGASLQLVQSMYSGANERKVVVNGNASSQWKAQLSIFNKVGEGLTPSEELSLRTEILVPSPLVGRIIGKGGSTVRQLQSQTGAMIEIPRGMADGDKVSVHIKGTFLASQAAQRRIRSIIRQSSQAHIAPFGNHYPKWAFDKIPQETKLF
ncbi:uncharacterized protein TRIADDRAFT_54022 [Trichoplax adhaerens]|uniref:RRM domain-containing protein n=1 Tax=Trichoplax adhaerens TaxID=10228 RepID=B3RQW5_TRIAD|nr:hypothetical protein TRIADDRAFT_54022 [Trichoplax adhaerens]EDV26776.1 hypothetical protein TRIADDRAFT_54022 [Trichoplax adhaerens]|eukprot:XP_002110772.1 hypothetical protein TRIADDRAFT_54022 [Trichoplax adhaerens]